MNYKKKTLLLIVLATTVRSITACVIDLGNDEVYYRMYAQYLQWNYFDHPPVVGWLIRFTTADLFLDTEFFIRLGAIISAAITTWFFFLCGKKLNNSYTGFLAAVIYTATIYGSIIAGTFILPDSPQMICWSAGLYLLISITGHSNINREKKRKLLLFAVVAGIGMLCKIHTSFLWLGFLLYIFFYQRQWLKEPVLYVSGVITIIFFYPVIQWNINNHFITYLYHSNRVDVSTGGPDVISFLTFAGGQVLYCNPVIFILMIPATVKAIKNKLPVLPSQKRILLFCSLPLIMIATLISLFKNVLPHWTGPAYSSLILLTACNIAGSNRKTVSEKRVMPKQLLIATSFLCLLLAAGTLLINFFPGTIGKKDRQILGEGDFTLDMYGWNDLEINFARMVKADLESGIMKNDAVIISNKWFPASHIDYYVAIPVNKHLLAVGDINDIHQYAWINRERKKLQPGADAYCIVPSNYNFDVENLFVQSFTTILPPEIIEQERNGNSCRRFYIWRLKDFLPK